MLKLYRACSTNVAFFVTGDMKSDTHAARQFCSGNMNGCRFYDVVDQDQLDYACHSLIGWNTIGRRNIALLEALKWGADIIVTCDDDNIPMSMDYFDRFEAILCKPFSGLAVTPEDHRWWDVGQLLIPRAPHRGFPYLGHDHQLGFSHIVGAKVGVAAGICLGDPDIGAVERIANQPTVLGVAEPLQSGVAVSTHTVFNSQNTAFTRELAPCFLMVPQFRRYDDIFASLVAQRVMRELGQVVHFGQPFVWQQRNPHDLLKDLEAEMWGMKHVLQFADLLDDMDLPKTQPAKYGEVPTKTPLLVKAIYDKLSSLEWMPAGVRDLSRAWYDDICMVMA